MPTAELNKMKRYLIALINRLSDENVIEFLDGLKKSKSWYSSSVISTRYAKMAT